MFITELELTLLLAFSAGIFFLVGLVIGWEEGKRMK
jgi:hypothetical protein